MSQPESSPASTSKPPAQRLLIVRMSAMGDIIHAMPALTALRHARPELQIGWLIEERWSPLLCSTVTERLSLISPAKPLVDWVHFTNFASWRKALLSDASWRQMRDCVREVRDMNYQIALDFQGTIRSASAAMFSGATRRFGSTAPREAPARMLYTRTEKPEGAHVIEQALSLASAVAGEPLSYEQPEFPVAAADESWAEKFVLGLGNTPVAIVNAGAGWGAKCWPAERYGIVARALVDRGWAVVVNHGPSEQALARSVHTASGGTAQPLLCSVGELISLMRRAGLFVGGDTGPMHLAAAMCVPVVALFGPTRPERNGPFSKRSIVLRNPESVSTTSHTARYDPGLFAIQPQEVINAVERLLGEVNG